MLTCSNQATRYRTKLDNHTIRVKINNDSEGINRCGNLDKAVSITMFLSFSITIQTFDIYIHVILWTPDGYRAETLCECAGSPRLSQVPTINFGPQ